MTAYQVLARKWRPKKFADLVGQQHVVKALQNALNKGRLHHAYLLTGTRGVGKTTIARILAKSLNCEQAQHGEPCGVCPSCQAIDAGRFVDLLEIDAASNTGIDNIREVLENAQYAPTAGKYKVYIIDEVHMLSKSAFNAMLKTLEEPPEHVKFILATTDPHKVPITVLSRCLQFILRNMTSQQVTEHLAHVLKSEQIVYEPTALALLGRAAQGSMRDALSLLDQAIAMGSGSVQETDVRQMIGAVDKRYLYELLEYLMEQNGEQLLVKAQEMASNAIGFDSALNDLAALLQRLAMLKAVPNAIEHEDPERERLLHLARYFSDEQIQLYYQCVIHGKQDLPLAPDEYAGFVMTLLRMLAFAPFAAQNTALNSSIEGTQLRDFSEKKTEFNPAISGSLKQENADLSIKSEIQHIENKSENSFSQPESISQETISPAESAPTNNITPENNVAIAEPLADSDNDSPPWQPNHENSPEPTHSGSLNPQTHESPTAPEFNHAPNTQNAETQTFRQPETPPQDSGSLNAYNDESQHLFAQNSSVTTPEPEAKLEPMPELNAANWPHITQRISRQIAAARMGLDNMAWVDFNDGVLHLAMVAEQAKNKLNKTYFDRIANALSDAYQQNIRIQTQDFQADQGWETPAMYRTRMATENTQHARQLMEQDLALQQLQQQFDAKWVDSSIQLKP